MAVDARDGNDVDTEMADLENAWLQPDGSNDSKIYERKWHDNNHSSLLRWKEDTSNFDDINRIMPMMAVLNTTTKEKKTVTLVGRARIQCVQGSCEILGYRLSCSSSRGKDGKNKETLLSSISPQNKDTVEIESPAWNNALTIHLETDSTVNVHSLRPIMNDNSSTIRQQPTGTMEKMQPIFSLKEQVQPLATDEDIARTRVSTFSLTNFHCSSPVDNNTNDHSAINVIAGNENDCVTIDGDRDDRDKSYNDDNSSVNVQYNINFPSQHFSEVRPTIIPISWKDSIDNVLTYIQKSSEDSSFSEERKQELEKIELTYHRSFIGDAEDDEEEEEVEDRNRTARIVFCGAKGVGKSTCLRYAVNRILSSSCQGRHHFRKVVILDADVGQPEMSPPGMVTLTVVSEPLLSPPHMHMVVPTAIDEVDLNRAKEKKVNHESGINHSNMNSSSSSTNTEKTTNTSITGAYHFCQARYYGSVTSKQNPSRYIECISQLLKHFNDEFINESDDSSTTPPLLINLDGWIKGMGYQVLMALLNIECINPTHIIQIIGDSKSQQFDIDMNMLPPDAIICKANSYNNSIDHTTQKKQQEQKQSGEVSLLQRVGDDSFEPNSTSNDNSDNSNENLAMPPLSSFLSSSSIPSSALRSLRFCTYFMNNNKAMWDQRLQFGQTGITDNSCEIGHRLASFKPYVVPFECVRCLLVDPDAHDNDLDSEDMLLDVFNASIVGLCYHHESNLDSNENTDDDDDDSYSDDNNFAITSNMVPSLPCVGLGLIRAIDRDKRLFFILSPVPQTCIKSVNVIVGGGHLDVPIECLFRGIHSEAFPFLSFEKEFMTNSAIGSEPMKSRNNITRKVTEGAHPT